MSSLENGKINYFPSDVSLRARMIFVGELVSSREVKLLLFVEVIMEGLEIVS